MTRGPVARSRAVIITWASMGLLTQPPTALSSSHDVLQVSFGAVFFLTKLQLSSTCAGGRPLRGNIIYFGGPVYHGNWERLT